VANAPPPGGGFVVSHAPFALAGARAHSALAWSLASCPPGSAGTLGNLGIADPTPQVAEAGGYAPCPSFSRSVPTDYRFLTLRVKKFVLADKDFVLDSNPALRGGVRTDKPSPLHSFITGTWFVVQSLRFTPSKGYLDIPDGAACLRQAKSHREPQRR